MPSSQFSDTTVFDSLSSFEKGINMGRSPLRLQRNQLFYGSNLTVRNDFAHPRPPRRNLALDFGGNVALQTAVTKGKWQGGCHYKPDAGVEVLIGSISGRLYKFTPTGITATVSDITGANAQSAAVSQCWLWQAENFVFWNDGVSLPVFYNGTTTIRSNGVPSPPPANTFTTFGAQKIPAGYTGVPPGTDVFTLILTSPFIGASPDPVVLSPGSATQLNGRVVNNPGAAGANSVDIQFYINLNNAWTAVISSVGSVLPQVYRIAAGSILQNIATYNPPPPQFPIGRMGCYGKGRVWMVLADGKQFVAGDIVGGPSGTKALNFRDAILNITENQFLVGGGNFTVPGSVGDIRAMIFTAELDASLGQGPIQIFTPTHVFSCSAPVDRLTWQSITNPILTESAIGNGGLGQYATFNANSDTITRSLDGLRSLKLAREDFNLWLRTPISHEVERILNKDNQALLPFATGGFFDNRILMSASPIASEQGVYNQALVALNTDPQSSVGDKSAPVYDGVWPGMNLLQMTIGEFQLVERCYQFCFNPVLSTIELWELMPQSSGDVVDNPDRIVGDNGTDAIEWWFESASLFNEPPQKRTFKRLINGEIFVDKIVGRVDFQSFYKPDQYSCWIPWLTWSVCADATKQPAFNPRMGLGTPSMSNCDRYTNRPFPEAYSYQFKLVVVGQCEFIGARFGAIVIPEPTFAPPLCKPLC